MLLIITHGPSQSARDLFATTMLETGALKWMVGLVLDKETVRDIVNSNSLDEMVEEMDEELINVSAIQDKEEIEIIPITGNNFYATLMIVHDPSRVSVATTYPFSKNGKSIEEIAKENNAIGGINGGLFSQDNYKGGYPLGVVVSQGKIVWNSPGMKDLYLIGFDNKNILRIISLSGKNKKDVENLVKKEKIRDAVTFSEEVNEKVNHFTKLIINGVERNIKGTGSGANPRTVIGQREDGSVLLLVTDGRGAGGHLGATASDLIKIMKEYNAINAANLDGGSSSAMWYKDKYLMNSTTLYYSNSSYKLPDCFIVK